MTKAITIAPPFDYSPVFEWNYNCDSEIVINQGGTSSGKTFSILLVLIMYALAEPNQVITVVGQDVPNLKGGSLRDFKTILSGAPVVRYEIESENKTDRIYNFRNGSLIEFKSFKDPQDAKNGKRDYLFINEANGVDYDVFCELYDRTRKQSFLDYNPTSKFWAHKELIGKSHVTLLISHFEHNYNVLTGESFLNEKTRRSILRYKKTNPRRWRVYGRGLTGKVEGTIFKNVYQCATFPEDAKKVSYAMDFGFTDPNTLIKCGLYDKKIYGQELIYESGMTDDDLHQRFIELGMSKKDEIVADPSGASTIAYLKKRGWNIKKAVKAKDSIIFGIKQLLNYDIVITHDSPNWLEEADAYKWKKRNGQYVKDQPEDKNNHCWDPCRYWAESVLNYKKKRISKYKSFGA